MFNVENTRPAGDVNPPEKSQPNDVIALPDARIGIVIDSSKYGQHVAVIDAADYASVAGYRWRLQVNPRRHTPYAIATAIREDGARATVYLHRLVVPGVEQVDHIDGDGLRNTRDNLRAVTNTVNQRNARLRKTNTSGFRGVNWHKRGRRWVAQISVDGAMRYLGLFDTAVEAAKAWLTAAEDVGGYSDRVLDEQREAIIAAGGAL